MLLAGHQPNYIPYLGVFHKISQCDVFAVVDTVQFVKRGPFGFMSRTRIRTHTGWMWLTVPVLTRGKFHQRIIDTRINNALPWRHKHWRALLINYGKARYFRKYAGFFEDVYQREWEKLVDLNVEILLYLVRELGIKVKVTRASEFNPEGKGTDLIIDMCRKLGADSYLHGRQGKNYIDGSKFERHNIGSVHQEFEHPVYRQRCEPFLPNMGAVDLLFNHGGASLDIIREESAKGAEGRLAPGSA